MSMSLYEIDKAIEQAIEDIFMSADEETGEVNAEGLARLDELKEDRKQKLDNIGAFIKNLEADVVAMKEEQKKLGERIKSKANKIERLKAYVSSNLIKNGDSKFETARVLYSFRKSESVNILDKSKLPKKFFVKKIEFEPDKKAIGEALKSGQSVKGAEILVKQNLQIK